MDLVANDVLLHGEAERAPATDLAVVGLEKEHTRASLMKITKLYAHMDKYQKTTIDGVGFPGP
ncbi:hypothetical protein E2562_022565 [Oryza meyeriana var. granulata]|uniref:Uncharacterized protein n=1 Tax=Oryza meyeriana var. granulata TaxID=110450 RepID=A0A6G1CHT9_9ORYZ|nr:hypothetical protein E2562_022565 [Oryza meyeriana var. granulata]